MPIMNGFEATRILRLSEATAKTPIIALTGKMREEDLEKCITAGMNAWLTKPVKKEALVAMITQWATAKAKAA